PGQTRQVRRRRRVRAHAGRARRPPLPVRQPRLLGAVQLRQRPGPRGTRTGRRRLARRLRDHRARQREHRRDQRPDDHRTRAGRRRHVRRTAPGHRPVARRRHRQPGRRPRPVLLRRRRRCLGRRRPAHRSRPRRLQAPPDRPRLPPRGPHRPRPARPRGRHGRRRRPRPPGRPPLPPRQAPPRRAVRALRAVRGGPPYRQGGDVSADLAHRNGLPGRPRPPEDRRPMIRRRALTLLIIVLLIGIPAGYLVVSGAQSRASGKDKAAKYAATGLTEGWPSKVQRRIYQVPIPHPASWVAYYETNNWKTSRLYVEFETTDAGLNTFLTSLGATVDDLGEGKIPINER